MAKVNYKVRVKGIRPYFHHSPENAFPDEERPKPRGKAGNNPDEWRDSVYANKETRELYIPARQIRGVWGEGAKHTKRGRYTLKNTVMATLWIESGDKIPTGLYLPENWETETLTKDSEQEVYLDVQPCRNPSTRGLNMRYRVAMKPGWEISFIVSFENTLLTPQEMEATLIDGGRLYGLGNGRAIGMGRFEVVSFEEI